MKTILEWPTVCPTNPILKKVIIYYDQWQPLYRKLRDEATCQIEFIQDTPTEESLIVDGSDLYAVYQGKVVEVYHTKNNDLEYGEAVTDTNKLYDI